MKRIKDGRFGREIKNILLILFAALISSLGMHVFVYPADFAPSGVDGIATMLYEITGWNAAYYILLINLPLLAIAYFFLSRRYVVYTVLFTVISSMMMIFYEQIDLYTYIPIGDGLISAVFSGFLFGVRTGIMLKIGASSGGIDIIACIVQKKMPHKNTENIIVFICYSIIAVSYFIYGNISSVLLSVIQMVIFERASASVQKENRNAIEVKIITKDPDSIRHDIIYNLKHGATVIDSRGMYTDGESFVIISIINIRQLPEFLEIMKKHPDSFAYFGEVSGVIGNFRWQSYDEAV